MKKAVILLLLIVATAWGQDSLDVVTIVRDTEDITWGEHIDSLIITHNPDYEYPAEITEKCDTTWCVLIEDINNVTPIGLICGDRKIYKIDCYTDTTWGNKIKVWLTPEEHKKLMELLKQGISYKYNKDGKPCFVTVKEWICMQNGNLEDLEILEKMERLYQKVKDKNK